MANITNNYNLNKPLKNEKVNIDLINQNMDIIDSNLKSLSDEINEVKTDIPSTAGLVTATTLNNTLSSYAKKSDIPSDYLKSSDIYSWAKATTKPTYTANEVGADISGSASNALSDAKTYTDTKISELINSAPTTLDTLGEIATAMQNNKSVIDALDEAISSKADISAIPKNISQLTNDAGYLTSGDFDTSQNHVHSNKTVLDAITQDYIDKIDGIAEGAEVNVQSDWNAVGGDAFIKNKPELAAVATTGSYSDLINKPTIPSAITVDSAMSSTSTNPVQNKVMYEALNNKADNSHGTHVTYSTTVPSSNGTASVGTATTVSRSDHVHPLQTSVTGSSGSCTGNAATATKATQDESGNNIKTSYASSASLSGNKLLLKSKSGATLSTVDLSSLSGSDNTSVYYQTTEPTSAPNGSIWIG